MTANSRGNTASTVAMPAPTATIITVKPIATPSMCGIVRLKPKRVPDAISIRLFGPGVTNETSAKAVSARNRVIVMPPIIARYGQR